MDWARWNYDSLVPDSSTRTYINTEFWKNSSFQLFFLNLQEKFSFFKNNQTGELLFKIAWFIDRPWSIDFREYFENAHFFGKGLLVDRFLLNRKDSNGILAAALPGFRFGWNTLGSRPSRRSRGGASRTPDNFRKFSKYFLRKLKICIILAYFSNILKSLR